MKKNTGFFVDFFLGEVILRGVTGTIISFGILETGLPRETAHLVLFQSHSAGRVSI
jgi:hypothetical protein